MKKAAFDYFEFFSNMAQCCREASTALSGIFGDFDYDSLSERREVIHAVEHRADEIKHVMTQNLLHEFLPPFDREDIILLSSSLDDVVDSIDDVALALYMYDVREMRPDAAEFARVAADCCGKLAGTIDAFPRYKRERDAILGSVIEVHDLEGKGDACHFDAVHTLFTDGTDALTACAWKDIYDRLESCCDACERAVDVVEQIILKNT